MLVPAFAKKSEPGTRGADEGCATSLPMSDAAWSKAATRHARACQPPGAQTGGGDALLKPPLQARVSGMLRNSGQATDGIAATGMKIPQADLQQARFASIDTI